MNRFSFTILAVIVYFLGIPVCCADYISDNDMSVYVPDPHMQTVNQELDKVESAQNNKKNLPNIPPIIPRSNLIEFSSETYWAKFDEPKNYSQKGFMSGYNLQYTHRIGTDPKSLLNMFSLQAQWADGKFKQEPYVGPSGIKDHTFDFRGVIGNDFYPIVRMRATGYFGFGYRYLKDNSEGLNSNIDDFTLLGYKRYSHYAYLPLGIDAVYQLPPNCSLESNLEYDYVVNGWEVDKLGVIPGYNTLIVHQGSGNGLRGSLRFNLYFNSFTAFAEAFYRYWNIARSSSKADPTDPSVSLYEPRNNTQEFGMRFGLDI